MGGLLWGGLGDSLGRRNILMIAMTVNALFAMLSCLALSKEVFITMRFLSGVGYVPYLYL